MLPSHSPAPTKQRLSPRIGRGFSLRQTKRKPKIQNASISAAAEICFAKGGISAQFAEMSKMIPASTRTPPKQEKAISK